MRGKVYYDRANLSPVVMIIALEKLPVMMMQENPGHAVGFHLELRVHMSGLTEITFVDGNFLRYECGTFPLNVHTFPLQSGLTRVTIDEDELFVKGCHIALSELVKRTIDIIPDLATEGYAKKLLEAGK